MLVGVTVGRGVFVMVGGTRVEVMAEIGWMNGMIVDVESGVEIAGCADEHDVNNNDVSRKPNF